MRNRGTRAAKKEIIGQDSRTAGDPRASKVDVGLSIQPALRLILNGEG